MRAQRKIALLFLLFGLLSSTMASAQKTINGVVKAADGEPLIGVSVILKSNKATGTNTDVDGKFRLQVKDGNEILIFSYLGFQSQEKKVQLDKPMEITLEEESQFLNEIVVIGYQEVKRKDLTGSVAKANMNDLLKASTPSFDQALAGRMAGVQVSSAEGAPGSTMNIVIRGANSINSDNSPLYVIDGFLVEDPQAATTVNPNDIESIDVLKDASATAIYGARGANGVVMITTKKGTVGAPKLSYNFDAGVSRVSKKIEMMDAYEFVKLQSEVQTASDMTGTSGYFQTHNGHKYGLEDYRYVPQYDWQDLIFQDAWQQNHNLTLTGGNEGVRYNVSASYFDQDGIVSKSNYNRIQGRGALTVRQKKFHSYLTVNYSRSEQSGASPSQSSYSGMNNLFYSVWGYRPVTQPSVELSSLLNNIQDPSIETQNDYRFNPILDLENTYSKRFIDNFRASGFVEYEAIKNLKIKVQGTYSSDVRRNEGFNNSKTRYGYPGSTSGVNAKLENSERRGWLNENTVTYQTTINKLHTLGALAGITFQDSRYKFNNFNYIQIPFEDLGMAGIKDGKPGISNSLIEEESSMSYLGRVNYNYASKYYITASMRADGSSKFSEDNRWGYFPSTSLAWTFTQENFWSSLKPILNEGKLRGGWGATGNNRVGAYSRFSSLKRMDANSGLYVNQDGIASGVYPWGENSGSVGVVPERLGNPDLKWETTRQFNVGLDLSFFKDRITLTSDWYNKITSDLLMAQTLPFSSGYGQVWRNVGKVQNRGIEFTINTVNVSNKNFEWSTSFNIAFNRNKVLELAGGLESMTSVAPFDQNFNGTPNYIAKVGQPIGMMYGYVYEGTYKYDDFDEKNGSYTLKSTVPSFQGEANTQPGYPKYKDMNGDGVIDSNDRTIIGKGDPKHIGGLTNNLRYRDFDLSIFLQWSVGNDILNANKLMFESGFNKKKDLNQFASYSDRWTVDNPNSDIPRLSNSSSNNVISSRIVEDGSYLRIKNITLGYNVSPKFLKQMHISKARLYMSIQNLYTFTNYSGYDPEVSIKNTALHPGLDFSAYPRAKTFNFGINLDF